MLLEEVVESFILSRKQGTGGAKGVARPKTIKNYEWALSHFLSFMQEKRHRTNYEEITRHDIRLFLEYLREEVKVPTTIYGILRGVRAFMRFIEKDQECIESGLRSHAPHLGAIPQNKSVRQLPTVRELKALRSRFDTNTFYGLRNYTIFNVLLGTGLRNGELRALRVEDVHIEDAILHVPAEGKTGTRLVPMDTAVIANLKAWIRRRAKTRHANSPWLFPGKSGDKLIETAINQIFRKLQVDLPHEKRITPHVLRHCFGTYYLANNGNMERCRLIMGHQSYDTLKIYLHIAQVNNDEAKKELELVSPLKQINAVR